MFNSLFEQVDSIIVRDPAARNRLEVITCYQGLHAVWLHRISHFFVELGLEVDSSSAIHGLSLHHRN